MTLTDTRAPSEFAEFYSTSFARVASQIYAYLGDYAEAQDLTQEAFCRAYDRWNRVSVISDPVGWVRRVAWNLATSRLRHLQAARRYLSWQRIDHAGGPSPDRVALVQALAKLPPKHRLAVVLHYIGDMSTAEIAEQRDVAEGTVRSWLSRGRSELAERLTDPHWTDGVTPPGVEHVVKVVRRRRVARRAAIAAAIVIALAVPVALIARARGNEPPVIGPTAPPASPSPSPSPSQNRGSAPRALTACKGAPLPVPRGADSTLFWAGEHTGRYMVGEATRKTDPLYQPVFWHDGKVTVIPAPGRQFSGLAVNSHGMVAGSSHVDGKAGFKVWTFRDGRLEVLLETEDEAKSLTLVDINNRGDLLLSHNDRHVVYSSGTIRGLPVPAGATGVHVRSIGDDGTVVGTAGGKRPLIWDSKGEVSELFRPDDRDVAALAIRGDFAVGHIFPKQQSRLGGGSGRVVIRWNLRTGEHILYPDLDLAAGVTEHGWVLAHIVVPERLSATETAFHHPPVVQMGDHRLQLNAKDYPSASFISDDGRVVGGEGKAAGTGRNYAFAWTCQ